MRFAKRSQTRRGVSRSTGAVAGHLSVEILDQRRLLNASVDWLVSLDNAAENGYVEAMTAGGEASLLDAAFTANDIYAPAWVLKINGDSELTDPFAQEGGDLFTSALMDGEDGLDHNQEGEIEADSLNAYLRSEYTLYLNFDGGTVESRPGDFWLGSASVEIAAFDLSSFGWGGREAEAIDHILEFVTEDYAAYNVTVTASEPASGEYTTIYVGGDNSWFYPGSSVIGVASYDIGNRDASNFAFVFTEELSVYQRYSYGSVSRFSEYLGNVITHEGGHTFGANHVSDTSAVMNPYLPINPHRLMFGSGTVPGGSSVQDTEELLGNNLGYAETADDYGDSYAAAGAVSANVTVSGLLEERDDVDAFNFTAGTSGLVSIEVATSSYGNLDAVLSVYSNGGVTVVAENDAADGYDPSVSFSTVAGQTYTVMVASSRGNSSGTYELRVTVNVDAPRINVSDDVGAADDQIIDFGTVLVGYDAVGRITIGNVGNTELVITEITASGGFEIDRAGELVIAAGGEEVVTVSFAGGSEGVYNGTVSITSNDTTEPFVSVQLTGTLEYAEPELTLSNDGVSIGQTWNLGDTLRGWSHTETLVIANTGTFSLVIDDIDVSSPFAIVGGFDGESITLGPGESQPIIVSVSSEVRGIVAGLLTIDSNDPDDPAMLVAMQTQVIGGVLAVHENVGATDDNRIDFGDVFVGETSTHTVTVSNDGDGVLTVSAIAVEGSFAVDALGASGTGGSNITLEPGESTVVTIAYTPSMAEQAVGVFTVVSDESDASIDLYATARTDALTVTEVDGLTDGSIEAGSVRIGSNEAIGVWELTNNAHVSLTISMGLTSGAEMQLAGNDTIVLGAGETVTVSVVLTTDYAYTVNDTLALSASGAGTYGAEVNVEVDAYAVIGQRESYTFNTADDHRITVSLSGSALAEVRLGGDGEPTIESINLLQGSGRETLRINSRGVEVELGELTGSGTLKALKARNVDLTGAGIDLDGGILRLRLADVLNGADISFRAEKGTRMNIGRITGDTNIDIDGAIKRFRVVDFAGGSLECDSLRVMNVVNDMDADVKVTQGDLGKLLIRNGSLNGDVDVAGRIGRIRVRSGAVTGRVDAQAIGKIVAKDLNGANITANSYIKGVIVANDVIDTVLSVGSDQKLQDSAATHGEGSVYLGKLKVKGTFAGSVVAVGVEPDELGSFIGGSPSAVAGTIGRVRLAHVDTDNGSDPFGLVAGKDMIDLRINGTKVSGNYHQEGDFVAAILNG